MKYSSAVKVGSATTGASASSVKLAARMVVSVAPIMPAVMVAKNPDATGFTVVVIVPPDAVGAEAVAVKTGFITGI
ncbi:hypothetical protein D3C81_2110980 [compost metagenome]